MTAAEAIIQHLKSLPESAQREVLDFVVSLETRRAESSGRHENALWSKLSLASAMRGVEEDSLYTLDDIQEPALLSEAVLTEDWLKPEEDAAWSHLPDPEEEASC